MAVTPLCQMSTYLQNSFIMKTIILTIVSVLCCLHLSAQNPQRNASGIGLLNVSSPILPGFDCVSLDLGPIPTPFAHPGIQLLGPSGIIDTTGLILLTPRQGHNHLTISNIGSSGQDGVRIEVEPPLPLPPLSPLGPYIDLERPTILDETLFVMQFVPINTNPPLRMFSSNGNIVLDTENDLRIRSESGSIVQSSMDLRANGTAHFTAGGGTLTVSNIGSSGLDGVAIQMSHLAQPLTGRLEYDGLNHMIRIVNPRRFVFETDVDLTTDYVYDHIDRRVLRSYTDSTSINQMVHQYDFISNRLDVTGPDTVAHTSALGLQSRTIYDFPSEIKVEYLSPVDLEPLVRSYNFLDNSFTQFNTDSLYTLSTGTLHYGHRFFEPGKSVSVDVLNGATLDRISCLYDLPNRRVRYDGADVFTHNGTAGLSYERAYVYLPGRTVRHIWSDNTTSKSVSLTVEPTLHRMVYDSVRRYSYSSGSMLYSGEFSTSTYTSLYDDSGSTMECEYIPSARSYAYSDLLVRAYRSPGDMYCSATYDDAGRLYTYLVADSATTAALRCEVDPNGQSTQCVSSGNLIYRTSYDNISRVVSHVYLDGPDQMRCEYDPVSRSMSCTSCDTRRYTSIGSMRCSSANDDGARSVRYAYADDVSGLTMSCEYLPNSETMSCSSFGLRTYQSSGLMECRSANDDGARSVRYEYSDVLNATSMTSEYFPNTSTMSCSSSNLRSYSSTTNMLAEHNLSIPGQLATETYFDGNTPGSGIQMVFNPNPVPLIGVPAPLITVQHPNGTPGSLLVTGDLQVIGGKFFLIDHPLDPENKYLAHSCVESPDRMNVYNGNVITDQAGHAIVEMPDYFEALNVDYRYQLTVMGQFAQAIVKEKIIDNHFVIQTDKPGVEVSWQVTGVRNDKYAQENPMQVEIAK